MNKRVRLPVAPKVIELFAGAGLFGLGFRAEGFRLSMAFERDPVAAATYSANLHDEIQVCDLGRQKPTGRAEVLIAGPPCQGFSSLGKRKADDPRNDLGLVIPDWAATLGASVVVVENVSAYVESRAWNQISKQFARAGYDRFFWVINAADIGAPQRRVRSFTVFSKRGRPKLEAELNTVHVNIRQAFQGLPRFPSRDSQHFTLPRTEFALKRIRLVPEGGDIRDIARVAPELVPPSWFKTKGKIIDIWGRMKWDSVAPTVRTGFLNPSRGRFLHPDEDRPISFREAARLQNVPDNFEFKGTPEQMARQIGNGVPLCLGRAMARAVLSLFN